MPDKPPRLPDVHVIKVEGNYADVVSSPICDFCGDQGPTWEYGCAAFHIDEIPSPWGGPCWAVTGPWCACDVCARLVDNRLLADLSRRQLLVGVPLDYSAQILQGFFDHMDGSKVPFG